MPTSHKISSYRILSTNNRIADSLFHVTALIIFLLSVATLVFLMSVSTKGFDIADEGYHLLASQYPMEVEAWPNVAHIYTGLMFSIVGKNIIALRILSEFLIFASASFMFLGLLRLTRSLSPKFNYPLSYKLIAHSMICLGGLFYYVHFDLTPSYNTLNAMMVYLFTGCLCLTLAVNAKSWPALLSSFLAGFIIGLTLLIKFPTAITLAALFMLALLVWPKLSLRNRLTNIAMLIPGMAALILVHINFLQSWTSLWHTIHDGIHVFLSYGETHHPTDCIRRYAFDVFTLVSAGLKAFWGIYAVLLLVFGAAYWQPKKNRISTQKLGIFYLILLGFAGVDSFALDFYRGGTTNSIYLMDIYGAWLMLFLLPLAFPLQYRKRFAAFIMNVTSKRIMLVAIILLGLPFIGAMGTANVITLNLTQYIAAWFGLMILLLLVLSSTFQNRWIFLCGSLMISAFASSQIISSGFIAPNSLNTTIEYQIVATPIGIPATTLQLDKATSDFFEEITKIAKKNGFQPGDDILAFSNMPGILFALGGKSPIVPWYLTKGGNVNLWVLQRMPFERLKKSYIMQNENGAADMPDLAQFGIHFPDDYVFCGEATWPLTHEWVRLWKPKSV